MTATATSCDAGANLVIVRKQAIFTISDADYAPMALALFDSARPFYQDSDFFLIVIGTGSINKIGDDINVIYIGDVLDDLDLSQRLAHYLQVEISTSIRPSCFQLIFEKGYERAIYIDPDIYVFRRMTEIDKLLNGDVNGVVTPHALQSVHVENAVGGDNVFLQCGIFNLGFFALKNTKETARMLDWWGKKLKWHCIVDWPNGYFVDQKWLEFLPVYFDGFHILKLPTYNFAPWNSEHHKLLLGPNDTFFLDDLDTPVAFIHFSGIKRAELHFMHMRAAYQFYLKKLAKIRFVKLDFVNYNVRFKDGLYLDKVCIFLYKEYVERTKDTKSNPLVDKKFREYLRSKDPETQFPIYIRKLFEMMPDIFVGYVRAGIVVNFDSLISIMRSHFSYDGVVSLETMTQLRNDSHESTYGFKGNLPLKHKGSAGTASYTPALLSFCNMKKAVEESSEYISFKPDRIELIKGPIRICIPQISESSELQNADELAEGNYTEIWVPSTRVKERLSQAHGFKNLTPIPYSVAMPQYEVQHTGLENNKFTVMVVHDFSRDFSTQNTLGGIAAFKRAFGLRKDVQLLCYLLDSPRGDEHALIESAADKPNIIVVNQHPTLQYYSYLHHAHCFLSLHEDIAFGYKIAEAMMLGKFVVATKQGGNTDFMDDKNSFLIDSSLEAGLAAEAARALTMIYEDMDMVNSRGKQALLHVRKHLSPAAVGYMMQCRIHDLYVHQKNTEAARATSQVRPLSSRIYGRLRRTLGPWLRRVPGAVRLYANLRLVRAALKGNNNIQYVQVSDPQVAAVMNIMLKKVARPAVLE